MVSSAPTRRLQSRSRCRFTSSTLRNGRPQPSSTEGSDRCRSDQIQVRSGALATIGTSASAGSSTSTSTRTFSRTGSMDRFSPVWSLGVDLSNVEAVVAAATAASTLREQDRSLPLGRLRYRRLDQVLRDRMTGTRDLRVAERGRPCVVAGPRLAVGRQDRCNSPECPIRCRNARSGPATRRARRAPRAGPLLQESRVA